MNPETKRAQARVARAVKAGDIGEIDDARRDYYAEHLADKIRQILDKAPPLKTEHLDRLRRILDDHALDEEAP